MVALGHSLELKVLAEGIERPEQMEFLRQIGCDYGQGYLFGRPQPAEPEPTTAVAAS
ncbi:Oxygen sensor protein DosP [compost metagenome]